MVGFPIRILVIPAHGGVKPLFFHLSPWEGKALRGQWREKEQTGSCFSKLASNGCCVWKGARLPPVRPEPGKASPRQAREIRHEQTASRREMEEAVLGITWPNRHDLLGAPSPVPLCTPSPCVHRSTSPPLLGLYFCPHALKTHWQGSLWLLAVSLGHLQLPFPCLGKRVGGKKG